MKFSIATTVALSMAAAAVPHGRRHQHQHPNRRDVVVDVVTQVATQTAPVAMVYVDQNGAPMYTSWNQQGQNQPTTYAQPTPTATEAPVDASSSSAPSSSEAPADYPAASSSESAAPPAYTAPSGGAGAGSMGYGISYAPYSSSGECKTADEINSDFNSFEGYGMVGNVIKAASSKGMKVFAGIFDISQVESEAQTLIDAAKGNWDTIDTVSVGNEVVNNGGSASDVVNAISTARSMLKSAGYNGKVVTVDTFTAMIDNPELCQASDYAAANCHAFFNSDITADQAGEYVASEAKRVQQACGGKDTIITESGWPSAGDPNGSAVPSPENQKAAISSLRNHFSNNIVLFSAFNDGWKDDFDGSFGAERYWGIYGNAPA
ncbi:Cell surface mannoprotein mp65 [Saxophila tyrrhenica]|uniref:Cell surface mannoprotein mp65 n=1 Tax=Saxophila tyrrhenica TaxID=1690608 RepID=A0AAV9PKX7_9PEZI|nr:Cell surface mannoprotein mp65 [Saxophila tyrrhenica]